MFGLRRRSRPVDFGPYPLETLARDESVAASEAARAPIAPQGWAASKSLLGMATEKFRAISALHREVQPAVGKAPVPDDLARRSKDLKGAAYFLDASEAGLCKVPDNAWLQGASRPAGHTHALVILVEYGDSIDPANMAAGWVKGEEQNLAATRGAEIVAILGGYIAQLGFLAKAHWPGESEVDLERLSILAGLAMRQEASLESPFFGARFAIAAVTMSYDVAVDAPLDGKHANKAKGLGYLFGTSGAVSGIERQRRKRRPSHLGPYPVETLKRQAKPTTVIFDDEVPRLPARSNFYFRAEKGDMGARALKERPRWAYKHPLAQGLLRIMWSMVPHQDGVKANQMVAGTSDPERNAQAIKALSHYLGSAITGICEVPDYAWYSHKRLGEPINPYHKYAVVMLIDQGHETFEGACGDDYISGSQSMRGYMRGAEIAGTMAEHIRLMGHSARSQSSLDSDVIHPPLVLLAGLGEQSRFGETVVNPFLGPRFKTVVLTTDMPLAVDQPIDFGLQTFCGICVKCARECPSGSIPVGPKVIYNGYETWKPDSEKCTRYRMLNMKGSACGRCIKVCPLTKDVTWDGPLLTRLGSWLGVNAMWLKPYLAPLGIWLDDKLGHGNPNDAKKWWLDLEVSGEKCHQPDPNNVCVLPPQGVNRKYIRPDRKIDPQDQKIAYFPASVVPPPTDPGPFPADRELGLTLAAKAESVEQARERRRRGGPPPEEYKVRW